uniref:VPS50 EARP/GARPII complex subunit n=1 Tax=Oreochromis niloticus TaxID=8128 RepID=A0A669CJI3_ORENI
MQKIKSLMARQGLKSPQESMADLSPVENLRIPSKEELRELREQPIDPQAEQEIIDSIEEVYFSNDSFDMVQHELEKLPPELNLQELEEYRDKLKRQQAAVSKKVADLILEKQPAYVKELERVTALQTNLQLAAVICTNARRQLSVAKEGFTEASLGLLANQRRRHLLTGLLKSLRTIKTLVKLTHMEEDYPGAIQLCLECQKAASTFKHYSCIRTIIPLFLFFPPFPLTLALFSSLSSAYFWLQEQLDVALSKTCKHFDVSHYTKVQLAYTLLGKTQTAMDQLHMHFTQAIHNTVFQVVLGYVELCAGNADTKFQKMQYKDLCTHITLDSYIPCLTDLCKALWEVMLSYHRTMQWHEEHDKQETTPTPETMRSKKKSDYNLNKTNAPILTNTTLNVIRLVGKYMQMMNILKPIAFDVIHCVSQLFDYYLYAVYTFFGRNDMYESSGLGLISSRLRTTLNRIQESLIDMTSTHPTANLGTEDRKEKVPSPHLSQLVVLTNSGTLYGLAQRVVATESLVFLAEQFESLQSHLDTMMPAAKKPFLQQFYSQTVSTASELRKPIYWIVAAKAIDYEQMLLMMAGVKWDIREIMSQHNVYVDVLLKEFEQFNKRLGEVSRHVRIPLPVSNVLWEHCIRLANRTLVEGYANVKKCSNEGRALMQLDFQQFLMKLEKLTDLRPIPDKEFVETYIKAYYLTENDMEQFIKNHREYSMKQLANLVNVCLGSHINKKARQKLLAAIDDIDRPKR